MPSCHGSGWLIGQRIHGAVDMQSRWLGALGRSACLWLAMAAAANVAALVLDWQLLRVLNVSGGSPAHLRAVSHTATYAMDASYAQLACALVAGIWFVSWMYVAARTAACRHPEAMRRSPRWALLGWIVPFGNLVIPKTIINDLWDADRWGDSGLVTRSESRLIPNLWWSLWLIAFTCNRTILAVGGSGLHASRGTVTVAAVGSGVNVAAAVLAVAVVTTISRRLANAEIAADALRPPKRGAHFCCLLAVPCCSPSRSGRVCR